MIATTQWKKVPQGKNADKDYLGETLLINPEIVDKSKEMQISEEACLSLPSRPQGQNKKTEIFWIQRLYHTT